MHGGEMGKSGFVFRFVLWTYLFRICCGRCADAGERGREPWLLTVCVDACPDIAYVVGAATA